MRFLVKLHEFLASMNGLACPRVTVEFDKLHLHYPNICIYIEREREKIYCLMVCFPLTYIRHVWQSPPKAVISSKRTKHFSKRGTQNDAPRGRHQGFRDESSVNQLTPWGPQGVEPWGSKSKRPSGLRDGACHSAMVGLRQCQMLQLPNLRWDSNTHQKGATFKDSGICLVQQRVRERRTKSQRKELLMQPWAEAFSQRWERKTGARTRQGQSKTDFLFYGSL